MRGGRCPHRGLATLIPRLTAHHISLMVSLMIQLLFLKSHPSALHPLPRQGPRPWDPRPAGSDELRSRRGARGSGCTRGSAGNLAFTLGQSQTLEPSEPFDSDSGPSTVTAGTHDGTRPPARRAGPLPAGLTLYQSIQLLRKTVFVLEN